MGYNVQKELARMFCRLCGIYQSKSHMISSSWKRALCSRISANMVKKWNGKA